VMLRSKEVSLDCTSRLHRLSLHLVTLSSILLKRLNAVGFSRCPSLIVRRLLSYNHSLGKDRPARHAGI
jgi:hypothetical protein